LLLKQSWLMRMRLLLLSTLQGAAGARAGLHEDRPRRPVICFAAHAYAVCYGCCCCCRVPQVRVQDSMKTDPGIPSSLFCCSCMCCLLRLLLQGSAGPRAGLHEDRPRCDEH
jgi:hypothetical protein